MPLLLTGCGPAGASGPFMLRTVSGLIYAANDFSAWTLGPGATNDTSRPTMAFYPGPNAVLTPGAVGTTDGGGCREPAITQMADGSWVMIYDAGDGTNTAPGTNWQMHVATSTDRGQTWTKLGAVSGLTHGSHTCYCVGGNIIKVSGTYYLLVLTCDAANGNGIPTEQYKGQIYSASTITGPYTWIRDLALGTAGQFDDYDAVPSWIHQVAGTWLGYKSARQNGGLRDMGRYIIGGGTDPSGDWVSDGNSGMITSTLLIDGNNDIENGRIFYSTFLNKWIMTCNRIGSASTNRTQLWFANDPSNFQNLTTYGSTTQRADDGTTTLDGVNAIGMGTPLIDEFNNVLFEPDGAFGFYYDGDPPVSGFPGTHLTRKIKAAHALPLLNSHRFQSLTPGTDNGGTGWSKFNLGTHLNLIGQFEYTSQPGSGQNDWLLQLWGSSGSLNDSGDGYGLYNPSGGIFRLILQSAGSFVGFPGADSVATATVSTSNNDLAIHNRVRFKRSATTTFQVWLNGTSNGAVTQGSVGSGSWIGVRGNSYDSRLYNLRLYTTDTVTLSGLPASAAVRMLGAGYVPFASGTADGSGNLTLSTDYYPQYMFEVNGKIIRPATGKIYGGDSYTYGVH